MTRHPNAKYRSSLRRLRPSPANIAAAAAAYDPGLLLQLQTTHRGGAVSSLGRRRRQDSDVKRRGSSLAIARSSQAS